MKGSVLLCCALVFTSGYCVAGIYKYKDAQGNWQFSDKAPVDDREHTLLSAQSEKKRLEPERQEPTASKLTPLQHAAETVVSINTPLGQGSGFFISDQGHLITNRHVVRPSETKDWKERESSLADAEAKLARFRRVINKESAYLAKFSQKLKARRRSIDSISNRHERATAEAEFADVKHRFDERRRLHNQETRKYRAMKASYSDKRSEFGFNSALSVVKKRFEIVLKNGDKRSAKLVALSDDHDLALLKMDATQAFFIDPEALGAATQGQQVYAIGSPIGLKNIITSGIVSRVDSDALYTDTQVLPGNSGGPLLDEKGAIIGVTTAKVGKDAYADGFGIAIPIEIALQEFSAKI